MRTIFAAIAAALVSVSCAPSTPQTRIERSPELFEPLPENQKAKILRGEIDQGMSQDAVWLAWGAPADRFEGAEAGKRTERWDYAGSKPVYHTSIYSGFGYGYGGYGRYGRRGYPYQVFSVAPEVTYVPYRRASVWFVNDRVDRWERRR